MIPIDSASAPDNRGQLLLETATANYRFPQTHLAAVIRLHAWSPVPGAPEYVLGTTDHEQRIHTILDPDRFDPVPVSHKNTDAPSDSNEIPIGLVLTDEQAHPCILIGRRVRTAPTTDSNDWTDLIFPPPLLQPGTQQAPIRIQRSPNPRGMQL